MIRTSTLVNFWLHASYVAGILQRSDIYFHCMHNKKRLKVCTLVPFIIVGM